MAGMGKKRTLTVRPIHAPFFVFLEAIVIGCLLHLRSGFRVAGEKEGMLWLWANPVRSGVAMLGRYSFYAWLGSCTVLFLPLNVKLAIGIETSFLFAHFMILAHVSNGRKSDILCDPKCGSNFRGRMKGCPRGRIEAVERGACGGPGDALRQASDWARRGQAPPLSCSSAELLGSFELAVSLTS